MVPSTESSESSAEEVTSSQTLSQSEEEPYHPRPTSPLPLPSPPQAKRECLSPVEEVALTPTSSPDSKPDLSSADSTPSRQKRKRIPYTLVEASKGNRCPTPGCDGIGHVTGLYAMHFAVSGCPKAHGKTPKECRARREALNHLRVRNMPIEEEESMKPMRRASRLSSISGVPSPTSSLPLTQPPRRVSAATVRPV